MKRGRLKPDARVTPNMSENHLAHVNMRYGKDKIRSSYIEREEGDMIRKSGFIIIGMH